MQQQLPKLLLFTAIFTVTSLFTYLSFHKLPLLHANCRLQHADHACFPSNHSCSWLVSEEDQWNTQPRDHVRDPTGHGASKANKTSKIVQAVMLAGDLETPLFERMLATHEAHSRRWGYETRILRHFIRGHGVWQESIFSKPLYILQLLTTEMGKAEEERAEWIVWFDSDTIILNPNISWELFLPPSPDFQNIHMIGTRDWTGFNSGVFFVRVNEWSINLLTATAAVPLLRPEIELGYNRDQDAMEMVLNKPEYQEHFLYQPINWFNGFHDTAGHPSKVVPGDLLVHFAGVKATGREVLDAAIENWLQRVDNEPEIWALPLNETSYVVDTDAFWSRLKGAHQLSQQANRTLENYTGAIIFEDPNLETRVSDLRSSHAVLRLVLVKEPFRSSKMDEAIRGVTAALDEIKKSENEQEQVNQAAESQEELEG